jgi:lysophospholipase L1-like esterase
VVLLLTLGAAILVAREIYADRLAARAFSSAIPLVRAEPPSGLPTLLLVGDSRVAEWRLPRLAGFHVVNAGFPGCTTSQIAMRTRPLLDKIKPQVVVIQAGINDLKLLGVRPSARREVIDGALTNIVAMIEESQRHGSGVVVTTVWPTGPLSLARRVVWSSEVESARLETNRRLEKLCSSRTNVLVIDLFASAAPAASDQRAAVYRDTLHLKPEVYGQLTATLQRALTSCPPGKNGSLLSVREDSRFY